jgi:hypothetical protein
MTAGPSNEARIDDAAAVFGGSVVGICGPQRDLAEGRLHAAIVPEIEPIVMPEHFRKIVPKSY